MTKSKEGIINDIIYYFKGIVYQSSYIGITSDINKRLFIDHNVSKKSGHWIYRNARSNDIAREVEKYFIDKGMNGGGEGDDYTSRIVYAYNKTPDTNP
jgi:hypothetical protein